MKLPRIVEQLRSRGWGVVSHGTRLGSWPQPPMPKHWFRKQL